MWMQTRTFAGMLRLKGFSSEATVLKELFEVKQRERKTLDLGKSGQIEWGGEGTAWEAGAEPSEGQFRELGVGGLGLGRAMEV